MYSPVRPPTALEVAKRAVPIASLDVVLPLLLGAVYYDNTTLDFTAWLVAVVLLDIAAPTVVPAFESTDFTARLKEIVRLLSIWAAFQLLWYHANEVMLQRVDGYSHFVCAAGFCWVRLVAPVCSLALFYGYMYATGYRQDFITPKCAPTDYPTVSHPLPDYPTPDFGGSISKRPELFDTHQNEEQTGALAALSRGGMSTPTPPPTPIPTLRRGRSQGLPSVVKSISSLPQTPRRRQIK